MPDIVVLWVRCLLAPSASGCVLALLRRLCFRFRLCHRIRLRLQRGRVFGRYPHERLRELRSIVPGLGFR